MITGTDMDHKITSITCSLQMVKTCPVSCYLWLHNNNYANILLSIHLHTIIANTSISKRLQIAATGADPEGGSGSSTSDPLKLDPLPILYRSRYYWYTLGYGAPSLACHPS
jgi:hypothetical protein